MASEHATSDTLSTPGEIGTFRRFVGALDDKGLLDVAAPLLQALPEGAVPEALRSRVASGKGHISARGLWRIADMLSREPTSRPFVALVDRLVERGVERLAADRLRAGEAGAMLPVAAALAESRTSPDATFLFLRALMAAGGAQQAYGLMNRETAVGRLSVSRIAPPETLPGLLHLGAEPAPAGDLTVRVLGDGGEGTLTRRLAGRANRSFCAVIDDALVHGFDWIRLPDGRALLEGIGYRDPTRLIGRRLLTDADGARLIHTPIDPDGLDVVEGTTLFVGKTEEYGHFVLEALDRASAYRSAGAPVADKVLVQSPPSREFAAMLAACGLLRDGQAIVQAQSAPVRFERLILPAATTQVPAVDPAAIRALAEIGAEIGAGGTASRSPVEARRIYLARKSDARRNFRRLEAVEALLAKAGFARIYLEDHAIAEQIAIVRQADAVIGVHGSAFFNLIWATPGTRVGLAAPGHWPDWPAAHVETLIGVFDAVGLQSTVLIGDKSPGLDGYSTLVQFNAPVEIAENVLTDWIAGLG